MMGSQKLEDFGLGQSRQKAIPCLKNKPGLEAWLKPQYSVSK
jgi:hypothetical protein